MCAGVQCWCRTPPTTRGHRGVGTGGSCVLSLAHPVADSPNPQHKAEWTSRNGRSIGAKVGGRTDGVPVRCPRWETDESRPRGLYLLALQEWTLGRSRSASWTGSGGSLLGPTRPVAASTYDSKPWKVSTLGSGKRRPRLTIFTVWGSIGPGGPSWGNRGSGSGDPLRLVRSRTREV